jgi:nitrate reductase NapE component
MSIRPAQFEDPIESAKWEADKSGTDEWLFTDDYLSREDALCPDATGTPAEESPATRPAGASEPGSARTAPIRSRRLARLVGRSEQQRREDDHATGEQAVSQAAEAEAAASEAPLRPTFVVSLSGQPRRKPRNRHRAAVPWQRRLTYGALAAAVLGVLGLAFVGGYALVQWALVWAVTR